MKKIGLVTFFMLINHGARLQAFALQRTIEQIGAYCEIVNFVPISPKKELPKNAKVQQRRPYLKLLLPLAEPVVFLQLNGLTPVLHRHQTVQVV